MSEWISVEDNYPDLIGGEDGDTVLALNKLDYMCVCWLPDEQDKWLLCIPGYDGDLYLDDVISWMRLPPK